MRFRLVPGPSPSMDLAELVLDRRHAVRVGQRCGCLEVIDRGPVVAQQRQDLPERLVELRGGRMAERQRRLEVLPGLGVRVDPASVLAGSPVRLGGLCRASGQALVVGDERPADTPFTAAGEGRQRLGDAAVEQASTGQSRGRRRRRCAGSRG